MIRIEPLGDRAFLARFESEDAARGWSHAVRSKRIVGVVDVVLAYRSVAVFADPQWIDVEALASTLDALPIDAQADRIGALVAVPVLYDGEDLETIASRLGLSPDRVIELHSGVEYRVQAVGFLPGFPYCGDLPRELSGLARRSEPRARVPAGSVAIVGRQTGVYPRESPGGWHLIGRTPCVVADLKRGIFPIAAGDRVRFVPIDPSEYRRLEGESLAEIASILADRPAPPYDRRGPTGEPPR